nr:glycosyltransferase family 2 protein [Desulfobacula sp.]
MNENSSPAPVTAAPPTLSVVVPVFNEEKNIPLLYQQLVETMQPLAESFELIFADDGSRDGSWLEVVALAETDSRVKGVRLSRNFGHQYALVAGLETARGDAVIMMDCDLQHPVEMIPVLLERWRSGFKVVKTLRRTIAKSDGLNNGPRGAFTGCSPI